MKNAKHYIYIELIICHFNIPDAMLRTVIRVLVLIPFSFRTHIAYKIYTISLIVMRNDLVKMYRNDNFKKMLVHCTVKP